MALISVDRFRELTISFPEYLKLLKKELYRYKDPRIIFLKSLIRKIFYLHNISKEELNEILYNLKTTHLEPGEYCLLDNNGSKADQIIFVESGCLEVLTYMEGNEFVMDNLGQGSIINHRNFLV